LAKKKFSRLSILLEARDKMSGPLQRAARASTGLSTNVKKLDSSLTKSKNSVMQNSVASRVLAEKYRQLSGRISGTNDKLKLSTRLFMALPSSVRMAAYSIEGFAKALIHAGHESLLVRTATKILTSSLGKLYTVTWNVANSLSLATKALWNFSRAGLLVKALTAPFKTLSLAAKQVTLNILKSIQASKAYQATANAVKNTTNKVKLLTVKQLGFVKSLSMLAKGSLLYTSMALHVQKAQGKLRALTLATNLYIRSNQTLPLIKNRFVSIGNTISKLIPKFKNLRNNIANMRNTLSQTGSGGRATFNQLAASNARLNKQLMKTNRELEKANSKLGRMKSSLGSINTMGAAFTAMYTGQMLAHTGQSVVTGTVGKAMEQQYNQEGIKILAGPEKGDAFYKQIQEYAASTAFSPEDWAQSMRGAIGRSKTVEDLEKYQLATEQLATLDPVQGLEGAALAIRELNSGDSKSLVERFELPRKALNDIKNMEDPIKQIEKLMDIVGEKTGFTIEAIQKMKELPLMQWQKLTNTLKTMAGYIGSGALEILAPMIERANQAIAEGKLDGFIKFLTNGMTKATQGIIDFSTNMYNAFKSGEIQAKFQPFIDLFNNIKNTVVEAWSAVSTVLENARTILGHVANEINQKWPIVNSIIQFSIGYVKSWSTWIANNWPTVISIIAGVVTALAALKIVNVIAAGFTLLKSAIALWRAGTLVATAAQWAMNTALLANPIGLVIALIAGLAVGLYTAYQKSETFRNAVQAAWTWIKDVGAKAIDLGKKAIDGLTDGFKAAGEWISDAWEKFKKFVSAVKNFKMPSIFGGGKKKSDGSHHGGLNYVPYDGYQPTLHKGERVLTAQENKEYSSGGGRNEIIITGNNFTVREDADIDRIADALARKLLEHQAVS